MPSPVIAITGSHHDDIAPYADLVQRYGGLVEPVLADDTREPADLARLVHGVLATGGADVGPAWYGESADPAAAIEVDPARDSVEIPFVKAALDADLPVLGVCRGMQVINVVMGGRLIQRVEGHRAPRGAEGRREALYHRIYVAPGSRLAKVLGAGGFVRVNSYHHQGLKEPQRATSLLASAYALDDGLVEGVESPKHTWALGVQCHPEKRLECPPHFDRLFEILVRQSESLVAGASTR